MEPDRQFKRADDPRNQCQAIGGTGQCPFEKIEGTDYCARHQGNNKGNQRAESRKYMFAKWEQKFGAKADHPNIHSLNEEIAVLQMTLETRINNCKDDTELLMYSGQITNLVEKIAVVNEKWHKIKMQTNAVMDKQQALQFITALSEIIDEELGDVPDKGDIMKKISDRMISDLQNRTGTGLRESPINKG